MMRQGLRTSLVLTMVLFFCGSAGTAEDAKPKSFYKGPALFSQRPSETKSIQTIDRFGPVGMGIELHQPAFVMKIKNIEEGSPDAGTALSASLAERATTIRNGVPATLCSTPSRGKLACYRLAVLQVLEETQTPRATLGDQSG